MKKSLFFFAAAALAFASCSNDETVEVNQSLKEANVISFRPFINAQTRAADQTATTLQETTAGFYVTAYYKASGESTPSKYFDNVCFKTDGSSTTYNSDTKYYWPASGTLDFFAYAPSESNSQITRTNYKTFTVTPSSNVAEQVDLIYANTDGKSKTGNFTPTVGSESTYGAAGVPLNFRHTGSKIVVKVKNSEPNNLKYVITGLKIVNVDGTATFTYNDDSSTGDNNTDNTGTLKVGDWTDNTTYTASYTSTFTTENTIIGMQPTAEFLTSSGLSASTSESNNMILIPQTTTAAEQYASTSVNSTVEADKSYIALKMVIKNGDTDTDIVVANAAGDGNWAIWPVTFIWEPGKKYTYTIDLAGGGYWEKNADKDQELDPILENAVIKFVDVTVDNWSDGTEISVQNP